VIGKEKRMHFDYTLTAEEYNYKVFDLPTELKPFEPFRQRMHAGERAPDFEFEDARTGEKVRLSDFWKKGLLVAEWGSFT
jgi:hypothetical protein